MLGKIEGKRRRKWQKTRWLDGVTDSMDTPSYLKTLSLLVRASLWILQAAPPLSPTSISPWHPSLWPWVLSRFGHVPMDCSPPGSLVHGILQARILEWVAIPPPGDLPDPGIESPVSLTSPGLAGGVFTTSATWKAQVTSVTLDTHSSLLWL